MAPESPRARSSEERRTSGIEELSRLMLEGWTMLAETCPSPDCHMPLARSREGRVTCCACHVDVVNGVHSPPTATPPPTSSSLLRIGIGALNTEHGAGDDSDDGDRADDGVGGRLAQGDTDMSNAIVPVRGSSAAANGSVGNSLGGDAGAAARAVSADPAGSGIPDASTQVHAALTPACSVPNGPSAATGPVVSAATASATATAAAAARRRDVAAAALGEKLLQGWTMLQDACARCATPLLRDSVGNLLCVTCTPHPQRTTENPDTQVDVRDQHTLNNQEQAQSLVYHHNQAVSLPQLHAQSQPGLASHSRITPLSSFHPEQHGRLTPIQLGDIFPGHRGQLRAPLASYSHGRGAAQDMAAPAERPLLHSASRTHQMPDRSNGTPIGSIGPAPGFDMGDATTQEQLDVGFELLETELAAAAALRSLRARLHTARDVESVRAACVAIQAAADAITAIRQASSRAS